jgi:hypothetical protein
MRVLLLAFLVTSGFAQSPQPPSRRSATEDPQAGCSTGQTYQGCMVRSGGRMMLIDPQNRDYILVSSDRSLENYVGHEVQVCAIPIDPAGPTSSDPEINPQQPAGHLPTLNAEKLQKIAEKCSSPKSTDKK